MAGKDMMEKTLEGYDDVFADIVNNLLFHGERVVKEDELVDETPRSIYKADGKLHEQERDVAKYWRGCDVNLALFGAENQTDVEPDAPLRIISYDGAAYRRQLLKDKEIEENSKVHGQEDNAVLSVDYRKNNAVRSQKKHRKRYPVVTLVLYFGMERWNKPTSLLGCLEIPEGLKPFVNDYRINLFEIAWLEKEQVDLFTSDFKIVADYFVQMRKNKNYVPSSQTIQHVDEVLKLMTVLTGDIRFEESLKEPKKGKSRTMSEYLDRIVAKGKAEGRAEGKAEGKAEGIAYSISSLMENLNCTAQRAMDMLNVPAADRQTYLSKISAGKCS